MARKLADISLEELSASLRKARERKGWTLEELSHALWERGFPTSQNKLWRMENSPPKRVDTELLLWLEKVLEVELMPAGHKNQVLIDDVLELIDEIGAARAAGEEPKETADRHLRQIQGRVLGLLGG